MDKKLFNKIIDRAGKLYGTEQKTNWNHNIRSGQLRAVLQALLEELPTIVEEINSFNPEID